jgi:hypothetical protein
MVSKKTIKAYDFETIEDYFEYIVASKLNGQHAQVRSLIVAMSKEQKKDCILWLREQAVSHDVNYCETILMDEM